MNIFLGGFLFMLAVICATTLFYLSGELISKLMLSDKLYFNIIAIVVIVGLIYGFCVVCFNMMNV